MEFANVYDDARRAASYSKLTFPGTYYLAFRDLPDLIRRYVEGSEALDFGCGTGRSTRLLHDLGLHALGIDISEEMVAHARAMDPGGDYRCIEDGDPSGLPPAAFDLVFSAFTFDNIPGLAKKVGLLGLLGALLKPGGILINLVSSPAIYVNEWASFSTSAFPENRGAGDGDVVRIVMKDVEDDRPVEDVLCSPACYRQCYEAAGMEVMEIHRPLGSDREPYEWKAETRVSPWRIDVLGRPGTRVPTTKGETP